MKPRLAFDGELTVYDERRRRLLRDGEYELVLYDARIEKSDIKEEWSIIKEVSGVTSVLSGASSIILVTSAWSRAPLMR